MGRKLTGLICRKGIWHIDKFYRGQRICESTFHSERAEAERVLIQKLGEIDRALDFKQRPIHIWREAATKYILENKSMPSIGDAAGHLEILDTYIGNLQLEHIHDGTLVKFIRDRKKKGKNTQSKNGVSNRTVNMALELVIRILKLAAYKWRDCYGYTWMDKAPAISKLDEDEDKRPPYPMSWDEQRLLLKELPDHLAKMALFKINTGTREKEVCWLQWDWEIFLPELNTSVFLIPSKFGGRTKKSGVKNGTDRIVILNSVAKSIIDTQRGYHPVFVFPYHLNSDLPIHEQHIDRMNGHAWRKARTRAAEEYANKLKRPASEGFSHVRVHDLKHTFGYRLRVAGVPHEDRQALLGHKNDNVTTHYSAPEIGHLINMAERVKETDNRQLVSPTILRRKAC